MSIDWSQIQTPLERQKSDAVEWQNSVRQALRDKFIVERDPATGFPVRLVFNPERN